MTSPNETAIASERSQRRIRRTLWTISLVVLPLFVFVVSQPLITRFQLRWRGWELGSRERQSRPANWLTQVTYPWFGRVDEVIYHGNELTVDDVDRLRNYPHFHEVTVIGAEISDDAFVALAKHNQRSSVRVFSSRIDESGLKHIAALPKLTSIEFGKMSVGEPAFKQIAECKSLEVLKLDRVTINDEHLAALSALPKLQGLLLHDSGTTDRGLEHASRCENLDRLDIRRGTLTDQSLTILSTHPKLRSLWLWECGNGDEHAKTLASASPPSLIQLMLTGVTTTDAALPHIAGLPKLRILSLWEVSISDDGLVPLASCPSLELLQLVKTRATSSGISKLQRLNPKLGIQQQ